MPFSELFPLEVGKVTTMDIFKILKLKTYSNPLKNLHQIICIDPAISG